MKTKSLQRKSAARTYQGLSYRSIQQNNSANRCKLPSKDQKWLKTNGYKNIGWDSVIQLYEKIADFKEQAELEDMTLEDLFLEADRIGNKYQTAEEVGKFQQAMAKEANAIADQIEQQFPQTQLEVLDFSQPHLRETSENH